MREKGITHVDILGKGQKIRQNRSTEVEACLECCSSKKGFSVHRVVSRSEVGNETEEIIKYQITYGFGLTICKY